MKGILLAFCIFFSFPLSAQDTVFIRSIPFKERVRNIDSDGTQLIIRLPEKLLFYNNGTFEELDSKPEKKHSWIGRTSDNNQIFVYHTNLQLDKKVVQKGQLDQLLPGFFTNDITKGQVDDKFFICYRGILLEYQIIKDLTLRLRGKSIRHVFSNDTMRIVSTYDGIYLDKSQDYFGQKLLTGTNYSSGELSQIGNRFFLCQDGLYELDGDTNFINILTDRNNESFFRKLLTWNNKTVCYLTNRVSFFDINLMKEEEILLENNKISDVEIHNGELLCVDTKGIVFFINTNKDIDTIHTNTVLTDIYTNNKRVILSGDSGIFELLPSKQIIKLKTGISAIQSVLYNDDIFFSNDHGLYMVHNNAMFNLVKNVEFNKMALSVNNNFLYAGSIDGLYVIKLSDFYNETFPALIPIPLSLNKGYKNYFRYIILIVILFLAGSIILITHQRKIQTTSKQDDSKLSITPDALIDLMKSDEQLITVQALADKLNTSVVQLNRKLKSFGETPLNLMQQVKKDISIEMHKNGKTVEQIAKRTGYSKRYVRANFLKKL